MATTTLLPSARCAPGLTAPRARIASRARPSRVLSLAPPTTPSRVGASALARAAPRLALRRRVPSRVVPRAFPDGDDDNRRSPFDRTPPKRLASPRFSREAQTWALLGGVATSLTIIVALAVAANDEAAYFGGGWDGGFSYMGDDYTGAASSTGGLDVTLGSVVACAIWSFGLFFKSPLQILLVFLGRTDTERPSDWMLRVLDPDEDVRTFEDASTAQRAGLLAFFTACGCGVVAAFDWAFAGEDTWGLSAGIGFAMLSFVAELGSPRRYSREELDVLEAQYADFVAFADESLERRGRCHGSEVSRAFRRKFGGRYGDETRLSERDLYTMILNWHPNAERTSNGYFKNLSLREGVDQRSAVTVKDLGL